MTDAKPAALVTGAAGFIGSHLVDILLGRGYSVIGVDNLSRGTRANLSAAAGRDFRLVVADLGDQAGVATVQSAASGRKIDVVWHMAANSDIPAGVADPRIDLKDTFETTFNTLEIARRLGIGKFAFASTSAIYGMIDGPIAEDSGPLLPISNYGAFKLASEAIISAAVEAGLAQALIFRFPNVVGTRATHGVIYDLLHKLRKSTDELEVLGDGNQQKPYLHVAELLDAMLYIHDRAAKKIEVYNIGPEDQGTTVRAIAEGVLAVTGIPAKIRYTGGDRGWVGDVPRFEYSTRKLAQFGWRPKSSSADAIRKATRELASEHGFACKPSS